MRVDLSELKRLNVEDAKSDVAPFIKDLSDLDIWIQTYFIGIARQITLAVR